MGLYEQVNQEMISAAKEKDKLRLSVLRMVKAAIHNKEIDLKRPLNDQEFIQLLSTMVKQRRDSIDQFKQGGRTDLADNEQAELEIILRFLPEQISEEKIAQEIEEAIRQSAASGLKDMGKVMKIIMPRLVGKADGKIVGDMVKARLSL